MKQQLLITTGLVLSGGVVTAAAAAEAKTERPNIVVILLDDMGFSDLGCYGGEVQTPNINSLASQGVRCSQFYTASRSCPTRASLMTGLFPHSTGIGWMSESPTAKDGNDIYNWGITEYMGSLNNSCVTLGEVLKGAGYHTYMVGKWHLGIHGESKWPLQRGFDRFYGTLAGAMSYMRPEAPKGLMLDNEHLLPPDGPYYTTDAFTDHAIKFIDEERDKDPFFLYLAYNAPHWPLQAKDADIELFYDLYRTKGWGAVREQRLENLQKMGVVAPDCPLAEWENRDWSELTAQEQDESAYRMAVYAAQIYAVDYNVGRLMEYLEATGEADNTLILLLSDNGACAEPMNKELGGGNQELINDPSVSGHPSYGRAWAQCSNTPFRKYKQRAYEGGLATPLIVVWGDKFKSKKRDKNWCHTPAYLPDIMPTFIEVSGAVYPEEYNGERIHPLVGESILPALRGETKSLHEYMFWEHQGNRAIRWGDWKGVWDEVSKEWELYDIAQDRSERDNLAAKNPQIISQLSSKWSEWAKRDNVVENFAQAKKSAQAKLKQNK